MATPAAIRADIARVKGKQGDPATVAWFDKHHGGIQNYLAGQRQRLAAAEAAQRGAVPAATVAVDATQQQGHAAKVVTGGNGRQEILMLFPSMIEQEVRRIHAEGGKVFPQATYAPQQVSHAPAAPAVPAVPGMPALGQAFAGIGAFINQYAPWLMVIALVYAVGTVLNIGVKAGVGK